MNLLLRDSTDINIQLGTIQKSMQGNIFIFRMNVMNIGNLKEKNKLYLSFQRIFDIQVLILSSSKFVDVTYKDEMHVIIGNDTFELHHAMGETDDATWFIFLIN